MARTFRLLKPDEIEVRVSEVLAGGKGVRLLLYKTARTDSAILDETFGPMRWQCRYECIDGKMYCGIGIKADDGEWIWKWNVGTESNTEAEKGQASDALKRAGFVWGLGAELYTAPKITVWSDAVNIKESGGKWRCYDSFDVDRIGYDGAGRITELMITNTTKRCVAYSLGVKDGTPVQTLAHKPEPEAKPGPVLCEVCGKELTGYKGKNNRLYTAADAAAISKKRYGRTLCVSCMEIAEADKKREETA